MTNTMGGGYNHPLGSPRVKDRINSAVDTINSWYRSNISTLQLSNLPNEYTPSTPHENQRKSREKAPNPYLYISGFAGCDVSSRHFGGKKTERDQDSSPGGLDPAEVRARRPREKAIRSEVPSHERKRRRGTRTRVPGDSTRQRWGQDGQEKRESCPRSPPMKRKDGEGPRRWKKEGPAGKRRGRFRGPDKRKRRRGDNIRPTSIPLHYNNRQCLSQS